MRPCLNKTKREIIREVKGGERSGEGVEGREQDGKGQEERDGRERG